MTGATPLRVLYVDDEPDIRDVVELALSLDPAIETLMCGSGAAALRDAPGFAPDIMLFDVTMPGMDGPATWTALRAHPALADVPAVFCTAHVAPRDEAALKAIGARAVLGKPFDPMRLAATVRALAASRPGEIGTK